MNSPQHVRAKLDARTEASCSEQSIENNKVHYHLTYESSRGITWLKQEVAKTAAETDIELELYKINTSGVCSFEVEVRELSPRDNVRDENQRDFSEF